MTRRLVITNLLAFAVLTFAFMLLAWEPEVSNPFADYSWFDEGLTPEQLQARGWTCTQQNYAYAMPTTCQYADATFQRVIASTGLDGRVTWLTMTPRNMTVGDVVSVFGRWHRVRPGNKVSWTRARHYLLVWDTMYVHVYDDTFLTFWTPVNTIQWSRARNVR